MGIDVNCVEKSVTCSYMTWHKFRMTMAQAVVQYIKELIRQLDEEINALEQQSLNTNEIQYKKNTRQALHIIIDDVDNDISFDNYWSMYRRHWRALKEYKIGGIFALLDTPDSDGVYSVGDAMDIIELINVVRPHIPEKTPYLQQIIEVFQESIDTKTYITTN